MSINFLFGPERGTAEMLADEIADAIADGGAVKTRDMSEVNLAGLSPDDFLLVICSMHGEGELPSGAASFSAWLERGATDLRGLRYAMVGIGDCSYDNYSRGSEIFDVLWSLPARTNWWSSKAGPGLPTTSRNVSTSP